MVYGLRDGDIISLDNSKAGALTLSVPLINYRASGGDPGFLWETQPAVRTVTGEIAREVAGIPIHHYRIDSDAGRTRVRDSIVAGLLRSPAPGFGAARWFEQIILDLAVWDRWAAIFDTDVTGRVVFRRLPPQRVSIGLHNGVRTGIWFHPNSGSPVHIPLDKVIFDVAPSAIGDSMSGGTETVSPRLVTLSDVAAELEAVTQWRAQVLQNGARVPAVIERPATAPPWDDVAWTRFKSDMENYRQAGGQAGGVPILEDGMTMRKVDVFNPSEFQTAEIRQLTLIEACLLFHYPPELLGAREGTYSNIASFRETKYRDVLGSWITNLEQALNTGFMAAGLLDTGDYVEMHVDSRLRGMFEDEARSLASATGRPWMTTNEARARKNLSAIEGGDELVTPLNVIVGGLANPRDTARGNEPKKHRHTKARKADGYGSIDTERAAAMDRLRGFWAVQAARLADALQVKSIPDMTVIDVEAETAALRPVMQATLQRAAEAAAFDVLDEWDMNDDEVWDPELIEAWIAKAADTNSRRWSQAVADRVADLISADPATAAERIRGFLESEDLLIALASAFVTGAISFGGFDAASKAGLGTKTWIVTSGNPRPSHAAQNGETVPIDDVFSNGLRWPGDHFGDPDELAGCQCELHYGK